jgi:hypothetical protein
VGGKGASEAAMFQDAVLTLERAGMSFQVLEFYSYSLDFEQDSPLTLVCTCSILHLRLRTSLSNTPPAV